MSDTPAHWYLVDYENVQPASFNIARRAGVHVTVFLGAQHTPKVRERIKAQLAPHGDRATCVRLSRSGKNALDMVIACYLGALASTHPGTHYHIVSADRGFDPLLAHMRTTATGGTRFARTRTLPPGPAKPVTATRKKTPAAKAGVKGKAKVKGKDAGPLAPAERCKLVERTRQRLRSAEPAVRPASRSALRAWIRADNAGLTDEDADRAIQALASTQLLSLNRNAVRYALDRAAAAGR